MTFIPVVPPHVTQASPNAQELGRRILTLIREYQQNHPDTSAGDVHQALTIAQMSAGGGPRRKVVVAIALALVLMVGLLAAILANGSADMQLRVIWVLPVVIVIAIAGVIVAFLKSLR